MKFVWEFFIVASSVPSLLWLLCIYYHISIDEGAWVLVLLSFCLFHYRLLSSMERKEKMLLHFIDGSIIFRHYSNWKDAFVMKSLGRICETVLCLVCWGCWHVDRTSLSNIYYRSMLYLIDLGIRQIIIIEGKLDRELIR